ncbi:SDR family NAD(P)-dependent oxidoreductase [Streptomyces sp900116325]|uniref:SDR family NAD(P)-dependent oxidoreductase n=1 Tax=Streptomyces sp. 900116325 TaxID=3154295 RepID=UPI0033B21B05
MTGSVPPTALPSRSSNLTSAAKEPSTNCAPHLAPRRRCPGRQRRDRDRRPVPRHPSAEESALINLNLAVPTQLAHVYGRLFRQKRRGAIILLSSAVGFSPVPYVANYSTAKSYIANLGQALRFELKKSGVDVLVLAPGPTKTEVSPTPTASTSRSCPCRQCPQRVVRTALRKLGRKSLVIPGRLNWINDFLGKHLIGRGLQTAMFGTLVRRALVPKKPVH